MRLAQSPPVHLGYCTNIHPAETADEVCVLLATHLPAVRAHLGLREPFGVGLRVSARAAEEFLEPAALDRLRAVLEGERLYVFTVNGFPYGAFHGAAVKERVYLPDWTEPARAVYTGRLAALLAALLPPGARGTISTLPGGLRTTLQAPERAAIVAQRLLEQAAALHRLQARTGVEVQLVVEPEPGCLLETTEEAARFIAEQVASPARLARLAADLGLGAGRAEEALRRHLGLCLDACHAAVAGEEPGESVAAAARAGVAIGKIQVSAGLRVGLSGEPRRDEPLLAALARFDDRVYLHQVVERSPRGVRRFLDLGEAFEAQRVEPRLERAWAVHCHVPLFSARFEPLGSTRGYTAALLRLQREQGLTQHLEVETYTWDVLPPEHRGGSVHADIARELAWTRAELGGASEVRPSEVGTPWTAAPGSDAARAGGTP